jgi:hypothetical protein
MNDLPVIQKTYDLIKYYIPILNRLPKSHKFALGDRIITELYNLLEGLITAQYSVEKLNLLKALNGKLSILRYQTRLLYDFGLIGTKRYQYVMQHLNEIGKHLGRWIKSCRVGNVFLLPTKPVVRLEMVGKRAERKGPQFECRTARLPTLHLPTLPRKNNGTGSFAVDSQLDSAFRIWGYVAIAGKDF